MRVDEEMVIRVNASWNGWQNAEVRLGSIRDLHWSQRERAPHQLLYGCVSCADIVSGQIPHDCCETSAPHMLRVCVLKRHVVASAYAELARRADERQPHGSTRVAVA